MMHAILICCVLWGDGGEAKSVTAADRAAYEAARAKAGTSARGEG